MATNELEVIVLVPKYYLETFEKFLAEAPLTPGTMEVKMFIRAILGTYQAQQRDHVTTIFRDPMAAVVPLYSRTYVSTVPKPNIQHMKTENVMIQQQVRDQTLYKEAQKQYNRQLTINNFAVQPPRHQANFQERPHFTRRNTNKNGAAKRTSDESDDSEVERITSKKSILTPWERYQIQQDINPRPLSTRTNST